MQHVSSTSRPQRTRHSPWVRDVSHESRSPRASWRAHAQQLRRVPHLARSSEIGPRHVHHRLSRRPSQSSTGSAGLHRLPRLPQIACFLRLNPRSAFASHGLARVPFSSGSASSRGQRTPGPRSGSVREHGARCDGRTTTSCRLTLLVHACNPGTEARSRGRHRDVTTWVAR